MTPTLELATPRQFVKRSNGKPKTVKLTMAKREARRGLVVRSAVKARAGWAAAFERMAMRGDDEMIDGVELRKP